MATNRKSNKIDAEIFATTRAQEILAGPKQGLNRSGRLYRAHRRNIFNATFGLSLEEMDAVGLS